MNFRRNSTRHTKTQIGSTINPEIKLTNKKNTVSKKIEILKSQIEVLMVKNSKKTDTEPGCLLPPSQIFPFPPPPYVLLAT